MKDKIFIGWSGSCDVAKRVKQLLEMNNYLCYIGGNANNDSTFSSVGDTVIRQIKECNQAIMIFEKRADGMVSNNLFFELGFVLARYGQKKIHCVKKKSEMVVLPSDFDSSFVEAIEDGDQEAFAKGIVDYFLQRQKMSIDVNKMYLINNRYLIKDKISAHYSESGSRCSDYELAQYILFYMQAAHMFGDEIRVGNELSNFKQSHHYEFSTELLLSINIALSFFDLVTNMKFAPDGDFYVDKAVFRRFRDSYENYNESIQNDDMGTFDEWAKLFIAEQMAYAYSLFAENPENSEEIRKFCYDNVDEWTEKSINAIEVLEKVAPIVENNDHIGIISLLKAYIYRNRFLSGIRLNKSDAFEWLIRTKNERANLKQNFQMGSLDSQLYQNFLLEYYLTLSEYLSFQKELDLKTFDVIMYKEEIEDYLNQVKNQTDYSKYVLKIESIVNKS